MTSISKRLALRFLSLSLIVISCVWLSACLKIETTFDRNGGGSLKMTVSEMDETAHERMKKKLSSPAVKLVSAEHKDSVSTFVISFEDAEKLRTAPLFAAVRVQQTGMDTSEPTITMTMPRRPKNDGDKKADLERIAIDLTMIVPGVISDTNGKKTSDSAANWQFPIKDLLGKGKVDAKTSFKLAADDKGGAEAAPKK